MQYHFTVANVIKALSDKKLLLKQLNTDAMEALKKPEIDSRKIEIGDVFICVKGFQVDGHQFAEKAIKKGASLLITERKIANFPQLIVTDSRKATAICAQIYYQTKTNDSILIGITGTNGKTTTSLLLFEMLKNQGKNVGLIGTLGYRIMDKKFDLQHTTPDSLELHQILSEMKKMEYIVMEISSHALSLDRVYGLRFSAAIFTNLSHDHLDFHESLEQYAKEKYKLFSLITEDGIALFNTDDECGKRFYERYPHRKLSLSQNNGDCLIVEIVLSGQNTDFSLQLHQKDIQLSIPLIGLFNVYNFSLAFLAFSHFQPAFNKINFSHFLKYNCSIPGRLEPVINNDELSIFVDYAHTPDALENVLTALKPIPDKRLICVFGAGGNRDKSKRPKMLSATLKLADLVIVTSDNPRYEEPLDIIRDVTADFDFSENYWIESDREKAIDMAVRLLTSDDVLLIAGKGHETYQVINNEKIYFDDKEKVCTALKHRQEKPSGLAIPIHSLNLEKLFGQPLPFNHSFLNVSTDSRECKDHSVFFALEGDRFDGHDYVPQILQQENCVAIVKKSYSHSLSNLIYTDNPLAAYGRLAQKYKTLFPATKIALTGSLGKTTTKEYLYKIISDYYPTLKTEKNENNQIGLPKTLFKLQAYHRFAIIELGSNHLGEIAYLTDICQPEIGIVTNIGQSHLEFFGDEEGVFQEKSALLKGSKNLLLFPGDDSRFSAFQGIRFGKNDNCDYRLTRLKEVDNGISFRVNDELYQITSLYEKNVDNALIAIAVAKEVGISTEKIRQSLSEPIEILLRMQTLLRDETLFLADCYNANPQSMQAAIDFWLKTKPEQPHIAVLGDMLELGVKEKFYHQEIGAVIQKTQADKVISVGSLSRFYSADHHFDNVEELIDSGMINKFPRNAVILLKASRGIHLEKMLEG